MARDYRYLLGSHQCNALPPVATVANLVLGVRNGEHSLGSPNPKGCETPTLPFR